MLNINEMTITEIQFFDCTRKEQISEDGDFREIREYSANIVLDDRLIIQLSGNDEEAHRAYIPSASEQFYNDEDCQDLASELLSKEEAEEFLECEGVENNFNWLYENATIRM